MQNSTFFFQILFLTNIDSQFTQIQKENGEQLMRVML